MARASTAPVWVWPLTVQPASEVLDAVLASAGARPADRDAVDRRLVDEVRSGGGRIIDSQSEVGAGPELPETRRTLEQAGAEDGLPSPATSRRRPLDEPRAGYALARRVETP